MSDVSIARIGSLRHRIKFQTLSRATDGQGGFTETWTDLATVWAYVKPVSAREKMISNQIQYQRSHEVIIRHRTGITQEMRFLYDGRTFQIKGVRRPDERKFYLIIDAEENQGT
jgi:SPP1 family predicted phage head-tail adaptor